MSSSKRTFKHQASFIHNSNTADRSSSPTSGDVEKEAKFWLSLIDTGGERVKKSQSGHITVQKTNGSKQRSKSYATFDPIINEDESTEDLNNVVEKFDLTRASTDALFDSFDENSDGELSHAEFRIALAQQDLFNDDTPESNESFERLIKYVDVNNDGALSRDEYAMCLQKLKLASLYLQKKMSNTYKSESHMNTFSYTKDICKCEVALADPLQFWFSSRSEKYKTSWIHMEGNDKQGIIQLASKYRFHPMFITDTIEMGHQQAKVRLDQGVFFVIFQQLQLTEEAHKQLLSYTKTQFKHEISPHRPNSILGYLDGSDMEKSPLKIETQQCPLSIFLTGEPDFHTIVTIRGGWEEAINHDDQERNSENRNAFDHITIENRNCEGDGVTNEVLSHASKLYGNRNLYTKVLHRLKDQHSTLRRGKGARIMYSILAACIQTIKPILQCYQIQLAWFRKNLAKYKTGFKYIKQVLFYKRQLGEMKVMLAPCKKVTETLMEQIPHMKNYFGDIDDELTTTLVSVEIYVNVCEELKSEYEHYSDAFTNLILLVLTLVTGVFIPINVYAAIFGMNFTALDWITDFEANPSGFRISFTLVFILSLSLAIGAVRIIYKADFQNN